MERRYYLDNIRWITVVLVIVYHVIYIFNSRGVISNFAVQGIPQLDVYLNFVYPWFMVLLFVVAGISANYALKKRTGKEFIKHRAKHILLPSIAGIFLVGWIAGRITNYYTDMFAGNGDLIPGVIKYLIYCFAGIGPLWFAHELFLASMVLILIRKLDKKERLSSLGERTGWLALILLVLPFWGSSYFLNTPLVEVYRNGFYIFSFLLGYYVFAHDSVIAKLEKIKWILFAAACGCGVIYTIVYYGENYTTMEVLKAPFTNIYAYLMILAILAIAPTILNFNTKVSRYMTKANFAYYALHYPLLCVVAFVMLNYLQLPIGICYLANLILVFALLPICYEIVRRVPIIRTLLLGGSSSK